MKNLVLAFAHLVFAGSLASAASAQTQWDLPTNYAVEQQHTDNAECETKFFAGFCHAGGRTLARLSSPRQGAQGKHNRIAQQALLKNWRGPDGFAAEPPYNVSAGL
jgi:hypothetical protein